MLIQRFENLERNILVLGADILETIRKRTFEVEKLYVYLEQRKTIQRPDYYDALAFLWMIGTITIQDGRIYFIQ